MASDVSSDDVLGQEFLTWLWFQSDLAPASFVDDKGETFSVSMEQRIVVQGGSGDTRETASVSGTLSPLTEARFGLGTGKKVVRAQLHLEKEEMAFQISLKASDLALGSMKTPKIEKPSDNDDQKDDPDALLLEKIYLLEVGVNLLDSLYRTFLNLRFSDNWDAVVVNIRNWLSTSPMNNINS
ncbi:MAG: hypothetical protein IJU40_08685 [Desulfovibrionaceae bacterium]|nr:hypothetical protein [Desulfovibrionaceae bacterium]